MKNTIENKLRLSALYYGIKAARSEHWNKSLPSNTVYPELFSNSEHKFYLELKPLSQISDEEAISAIMISLRELKNMFKGEVIEAIKYYKTATGFDHAEADYLRGNGYVLDYTTPEGETITVSEMIDFGWVKIKE